MVMKKYLLPILFSVIFFGFGNELKAQCPPTITTSPSSPESANEDPPGTWTICPGNNVLLTSSASSSYQWYHNGVIIDTATNISIEAKQTGTYYVMTDGCATPSETITILHYDLPVASITLSDSPVCSGETVETGLTGDLGLGWAWTSPVVSDDNPLIGNYNSNTTFIAVINSEDGCAAVVTKTLIVHQPIDPGDISADQQICSETIPEELTGPAATGGNGVYSYQWQSSTNGVTWSNISGATSLSYQPGELTETTLFRRIVFNDSPCPAVTQYTPVTITVDEIPSVTSPATVSICSNEAVDYVITSDVPGTTFTWTGTNTSGTVTGISASGSGTSINDFLSIPPGGMASGIATYTIIPTGPAPTFCEGEPFELVVTVLPLPIPSFIDGATPVCVGSSGNLYRTEPGMTNYNWTISNGGTINSGQGTYEISVTWTSTAGPKWVRVSYTGTNGCEPLEPTQFNVSVNPLPDPIITGPTTPCLNAAGNVYSTAAGMTNYIWNISGGTITGGGSTTDNSAIVTWTTTGVNWISITYTDVNGCTNTTPKQFFVNVSAPTVSGPQTPCLSSTSNVYTTQSGNTDYVWAVSPGGTITAGGGPTDNTATVSWNASGAQTVSVNYTTTAGCTAGDPATLAVDVQPLPIITLNGDDNVCAGSTGVVYTTESGKSLYTWSVSAGGTITAGGTANSNTATVTWHTAGPQEISVNYTDANGCDAESPFVLPVNVNPQPIPTIAGSTSECVGTTGIVYETELGYSNYDWTISGGTITSGAGTNSIVVNWTTTGTRWVAVNYTDASGCDAATATQYPVTVLPLPTPEITGSSSVCVGATNVQYATDSDAGITDYQWTISGGGTIVGSSTNANLFVNWNTVGPQTVSVTYTGANGCDAAAPTVYNVTVLDLPAPAITGWDDVCNNSTNVYTTQPGMTNYDWEVIGGTIESGGTVTDNTATVTWNTTGNQSISVNYEQTGCPATSPFVYPVFVNPLPIVYAGTQQSIPNGTPTTLTGTASGGTGTLLYQWEPVSLIATGENSLTATTENIYVTQIFELEVTDDKLCSSTDQVEIIALGDPLSVIATASPNTICNNGETVQLGAEAIGGNSDNQADYTWTSTPAGFSSTAQNPTVNPTFTTTYNVSVWDGFNTATSTILVTVNPLPTVFNVTGGGEYCSGGSGVNIGLNGSQSGVNYQLVFNGSDIGSPIPGTGNSITFTNNTGAGTYTVRAINATTSCENDMSGSATISINPLPTADAGDFQLIPYGTSTSLTGVAGSGTSPYSYLWTPAASISGSNTSLTATTTNLYTNTDFTFRVTDNKGCIASDIVSITLDGTGLAVTATAVEDIICNNGETVLLNAEATGGNSANIANYSWTSTPAGFTSNEQSPQVNPTQTTIYHVSVNDGFNTATNSVTVTVNPLPTLFTVTGGGEYCSGGSGIAVGLNGSQTGVSYQLLLNGADIGSPVSGTGSAISFGNQTSAGNYTVYATHMTTSCEREMTANVSISINPLPTAAAGDDLTINYGTSTSLNGSASSGTSPWNYQWTPDNMINSGANTSNPVTENLFATTDFLLTVTDSKGCTDTDDMQVVVVGDPLSVIASVDNSVICSGASAQLNAIGSGGNLTYTYSWSSDPGSWTSTEQSPVVNPTITTNYTVTISDGFNTATSSASVTVRPLAIVYNVTGGGSYCTGESGVEVGLSNSETGVSYQLYVDGSPVGTAVNGTGSSISFGEQTAVGSYTVKATVVTSGCENDMASSVQVNTLPLPEIYSMAGGGSYPQGGIGVPVTLTNSQIGVDYQLLLDGSPIGTPVAGTGSPLSFGNQTSAGEYTALALNTITGCTNAMSGSVTVIINPYPTVFHVYGGGSICLGSSAEVGIDGSEIGVAYTLLRDGTSVSLDIPGTGDSIQFGAFSTQGIYTVRAENISTGLTIDMDGFAEIIVNPLPNIYSVSYSQPGDNCVPIIPRLGGSQINAVYELNYEDFNGFYTSAIETLNGTGNPLNFSSQTNSGIYTVSAYIDYTDVICRIDMSGSLIADSIPKEFPMSPQGELCENDEELCLLGSEAGINYQLWLGDEPVGSVIPGASDGGSICFGTITAPGTYRIHAINTLTGCEIFFTNQVVVNQLPIQYAMAPVYDCAGSDIILEECEAGIEYYLYLEPANREFIEIQGPLTCSGSGQINFGPQFDEGTYRIKAVNPTTNCWAWMNGSTTIYPSPEIFEMAPQGNACPPVAIYLENYQLDVTYYLYRDGNLILSDDGSDGSVNFGSQTVAGNYTIGAIENHPNGVSCESMMSGSLQIFETPAVRTLLPAEDLCAPASFYLNSSETGITYELWSDISGLIQSVVSTDGGQIDFAPVSNPGQYFARAVNGQNCSIEMDGIRTVLEMPEVYTLSPQGNWCADQPLSINLSNSDIGFTYQLFLTGNPAPVESLSGTGSELNFSPVITPGTYYIMATNDVSSCSTLMQGEVLINIMPEILSDNELFLCNDQFTNYTILSDVPDATYSWIVTDNSGGAITGFADGTGNLIDQQLINTSDQQQYITYSITPTGPAPTNCTGNVFELTVFVEAVSEVTNPENSQSILSGDFTEAVIFSTNIIGQTVDFNWSASPSSSALTGYTPSGTGDLPSMQVFIDPNVANPPNNAFVEYTVTPSVNGCEGVEFTYTIQVQLRPNIFELLAPGATEICNDGISQVPLELSGSEAGVTYRLLLDGVIQPQYDQPGDAAGTPIQWLVDQAGIYSCIAVHDVTGVTENMTGIVEIVGRQMPIAYNLTTQQPNNNCLPITPRLSNSEASAVYELLLEDINGIITIVDVQNGTAANEPLLFAQQSLAGIYTVRARISYDEISCEAMMNGSITGNAPPQEFDLSPEGELCEDEVTLTILGSEIGVDYSLFLNGIPMGNTFAGTGNPISFGILQSPGTYQVHAINTTTSCEIIFSETLTVNSGPETYAVFPVNACPNTEIFMTDCEAGIDYYVYFEASVRGVNEFIEVAGPFTCGPDGINFGAFQDAGIYRIKAVDPTTNCSAWMDNNVTIWRAPIVYAMSPQGTGCGPITFSMEDFEADVTYFLLRDGISVENTIATGGTLSFSPQTETGIYTVSAQFGNGGNHVCNNMMLGQFEILPQPEIFTLRPVDSPICPPASFFLANSQAGVMYQLYNDQTGLIQQITSTVDGEVINFDPVNTPGEYWATATLGNCEAQMNGIRTVSPLPTAYNITPSQGQWCSNDNIEIGLSDSDIGFTYQLHRIPFSSNPIATVAGNGNAIIFGTYTEIGTYQVLAIDDATGCEQWMNGEIQINDPPLPFNITANGLVPQAGWNCPPVEIGLQLSETGVNYTLFQPDGTTTLAGTGAALFFGTYSTSGEYYVVATNPTTTCSAQMPGTINIYEGPEIFTLTIVGEDSYCFGDDNAIELVLNSSQPGVIYQLFKDDISNPVMAEVTGTGELLSWFPVSQFGEGNYFVMAHFADDPTCSATMNGNIAIDEIALPTASLAGSTTICESYCTTLNFDVTADLPFELIYSANGIDQLPLNFDPSNPDYSIEICPTEQTIYEIVSVNYTVHPFCEATDISGSYTVFVDPLPIAETGPGGIICETQGYHFGSAFVENASNWSWEIHEGQGSFDNPTWITPVFYPDPVTEITEMTIRLVAYGSGECVGNTDTSFAVIQVYPQPQAFAGMNDSACVNASYPLSEATAENYSAVQWEVISGSGSIDSPNTLNPNYLPHQSDVGTTVTLQLTATGEGPCDHLSASSLINIYIEGLPTANAGPSLSTCVLDPIQVTQATASHYSTINWTHTGNGTLTNTNAINPIYFPDITDAGTTVTLTLTATGVGSCDTEVAVSETNIQIDPLPEVFAGNDNFTCELEAFQLDEATATHTSSTIWSIVQGNGTINDPDELNATYTPAASDAGTTVILRLRGFGQGNCSAYTADSFINIEVITSPEANFEVATPTCVNELVTFEDASTTNTGIIEQWIWNFGDQSPEIIVDFPDDPNVSHTYTGPGNFVVTLTVVNSNGCEASTSQTIQITPAPVAAFVIQGGLCADSPVNFIDLSQEAGGGAITSWDWNFGDGNSSNLQNPVHSYDAPGTYTVTLTAYNESGCASNTFEATITIEEAIQVEIDDSNLFACVDEPYQFNATSAEAAFWLWDFGDGNTSTEQNPQHAYATSGAYFVTLTGTSMNGCSNTDEVMLIVNPEPVAGFDADQTSCTNEAILFTDTSVTPNGVITEWQWDMGDGTVYTINNPNDRNITHQFATPNQFLVSLTITDAAGCTDTHTQTVVVQPGPVAMFTYSASCTGQPVIFTDLSIPNGGSDIVSWTWDFGDIPSGNNNTSNLQNPAHTFVGEMPVDGYTVSLTVTNATGCTATISQQVFVDDTPFVEIIPSETEICLTESILFSGVGDNVVSWFWTFGDGNTSTLQNPTHTYLSAGTYNVNLSIVTAQGCTNDASVQIVVNHVPSAGFTTNSPVCLESPIQFNNTSVSPNGNIQTWIWDFGDGTTQTIQAPNDPNVAYTYLQAGTFDVTLTVIDNVGCEDSFTRQVNIQNSPLANFTFDQTCFGEPVLFTDLSSPNGGPDLFSWEWEFGDPLSGTFNSSNLQNPSHQFTAPGIFNVSLTVTNTLGCTNTIEIEVEVSETIAIDFTYDAPSFCPGETIEFTPDGVDIASYQWDFGDGGTSIQQTPQYIYSNPGTYIVSLTVTDIDGCQGYMEHEILINEEPVAAFSTDSPACSGSPTQFFNASNSPTGYITEWVWDFGDGSDEVVVTFPDNPDVSHLYAEGTYNASLTVTNSNGCSNTISQEVTVTPGPIAAFDYTGTCAESPVSFIDLSQENGGGEIVEWQWDFGDPSSGTDNTSTLQNPSHIFSASGSFDVTLIIANINGCTDTVMNSVTVDDAILVEIISDSDTLCLGTPASFTGNAPGAVIWNWDFGDGNTSTQQNPEHTYTQTGNFMVTLTAETADGCSNSDTLMVVVRPNPVSLFTSTSPVCSADSVQFLDWSSTQNGYLQTWIWDMGDGNEFTIESPDDPNITYLYANPGIFEVVLTVIDNVGCEHSSSQLVQVEASPLADFSYDETCFGAPVLFTDLTSTNGGTDIFGWEWYFGDPNSGINNTSTLQNPSHLFTVADTFNVTLIVTNTMGCTDTIVKELIVNELPEVDFTMADDSICLTTPAQFTGIGDNINTWFWEFGDGGSSVQQNPSYLYAQPGSYDVTLTVTSIDQCQNSVSYPIFVNDVPIADFSMNNGCMGDTTYFTDETVSLNGYIVEWAWDFGDGNTSDIQNPAHYYAAVDDYLVTLSVTDNFGCSETVSRWISIYDKPIAGFSFNQVCDPVGNVFFFDESESSGNGSPILEYEWNFHDGYFSNEINPNHIFPETDTCYVVSLTVTDAFGCESIATDTICIWEPITVDFSSTEVCFGNATFFEATYLPEDDSIVSYAWNFNDGSDIFLTYRDTTSHIFANSGTFFVELTATNLNGCEYTTYNEVVVNGLPLPDFEYVPGLCETPAQFTDLSDGNGALVESWLWNFGDPDSGPDNTSDLQNPTHLFSDQGGVYEVTLVVTNFNGCIDSITKEVIQDPCVQASFIVPTVTLCAESEICFTENSYIAAENGTINKWIWNFGDNTPDYEYTSPENPVCHSFTDPEGGDFVVSLTIEATVNGSAFIDTYTEVITINPRPTARFIPEAVCQNTEAIFTDNSIGNGTPITNWFWDFGDLTTIHDTSSMQNTSYQYPTHGQYDVQLVVINEYGCSDTLVSEIEIWQPPTADFIAVDSCVTYITYFNDLSDEGGAPIDSWFWHFGDPNSNNDDGNPWTDSTATDQLTEHIYMQSGTYFTSLVVEDENGCRDTVQHSLPVHPIPQASFTFEDRYEGKQGQVFFQNTSDPSASTFFWDFMTGQTSTEENPIYQFEEDGLYEVMLVAYNSHLCPDTAINAYEIIFTGLYFPNSFVPGHSEQEFSEFKGKGENLETYTLEIFTSWGQLIWSSSRLEDGRPADAWDGTYNNQDLPTGSYIWKASATFRDGTIWEGSDNGDGNIKPFGIINLIR